jgi:uncharacterized RDD family membrane protein YckC
MKCPNCEGALLGSAVVCKSCGHRLTQNSVAKYRSEHATSSTVPAPKSGVEESPLAAKMRARFTSKSIAKPESNLIQFPVPANVTAPVTTKASTEPAWRDQLKARVQDRLTRQTVNDTTANEMALSETVEEKPRREVPALESKPGSPDQLLLVESALKRIRRTPAPAPATVAFRAQRKPLHYPAAQSHALALMPEAERYAEAQRKDEPLEITNEASVSESVVTPALVAAPIATGQALKNFRSTHKLTGAHLTLPLDETEPDPEFSFDALSLAADSLPEIQADRTLIEAKPVEILRAKASYFAEAQAAEGIEDEPEPNPWHTDAEAEAVTQESDGQVWLGKPAPIWLRTLAGFCDVEAAAILYLPFFSAYYALEGSFALNDYYLMTGMAVVVMFLYQLVTFTLNGRTIGMALFGLRNFDVERVSTHISFARRLRQALGGTVGLLCPPFNFVVTRVTGFQRGFGDALAKTVTLRRAND